MLFPFHVCMVTAGCVDWKLRVTSSGDWTINRLLSSRTVTDCCVVRAKPLLSSSLSFLNLRSYGETALARARSRKRRRQNRLSFPPRQHQSTPPKMLLDVNVCARNLPVSCYPLTIRRSTAETPLRVRPSKRSRFPPHGTMDLDRPVQRHSQCLQPRDRFSRQDFRSLRSPCSMCQIHPS